MQSPQQHFYVLKQPRPESPEDKSGGTIAIQEKGFKVGEPLKCPKCGRFIGMLAWLPPFRVELETWGTEFGDVIEAGGNDLLVSHRFKSLYEERELTGLKGFEPVEVVRVKRHGKSITDLPEYFKASAVRSQTSIDQDASVFEWQDAQPLCPECLFPKASGTLRGHDGLIVKAGSWTGEDIFYPRGSPIYFITSSRLREICIKNRMKNVIFLPAETYSWHKGPGEP
jgi:hypothetical protein